MQPSSVFYAPNILNYFRLALLVFSSCLSPLYFIAIYAFTSFLDLLDGTFARMLNQTSVLGACLDMFTDRIGTVIIIIRILQLKYMKNSSKVKKIKKNGKNNFVSDKNSRTVDRKPSNKINDSIEQQDLNQVEREGESSNQVDEKGESSNQVEREGESSNQVKREGESSNQVERKGESSNQVEREGESSNQVEREGKSSNQVDEKKSSLFEFISHPIFLLFLCCLDILSHNFLFTANRIINQNHKSGHIFSVLAIYYYKPILVLLCVATELFYMTLFYYLFLDSRNFDHKSDYWLSVKNIIKTILFLSFPGCMIRSLFNMVQLLEGICLLGRL
ncbi:Phosphatidylinositol synthase [Pseudoloma neurophilia]|uniref:Phosphatidylinositol synthase n=1 Tax=Pseudoloma neurophilia TaxID=146866 RepID=A0A0R0LW53_9MICR|nr:Phosphatidylinositol synthase [Pseudoloma neurophilia]